MRDGETVVMATIQDGAEVACIAAHSATRRAAYQSRPDRLEGRLHRASSTLCRVLKHEIRARRRECASPGETHPLVLGRRVSPKPCVQSCRVCPCPKNVIWRWLRRTWAATYRSSSPGASSGSWRRRTWAASSNWAVASSRTFRRSGKPARSSTICRTPWSPVSPFDTCFFRYFRDRFYQEWSYKYSRNIRYIEEYVYAVTYAIDPNSVWKFFVYCFCVRVVVSLSFVFMSQEYAAHSKFAYKRILANDFSCICKL